MSTSVAQQRLLAARTRLRAFNGRVPLRVRLVAVMLGLVTIALLVTGLSANAVLRSSLVDRVDDQIATQGPDVVNEASGYGRNRAQKERLLPSQYYVRVNGPDGQEVYVLTSGYKQQAVPDLPEVTSEQSRSLIGKPFTVGSSGSSEQWRARVYYSEIPGVTVTIAYSLEDVDDTLARLRLIEVVVGAFVLLLLGFLGYLAVRTSLRPLVEVERTALVIAGGDLSHRVPERDPRTEVGRLGRAFNAMVAQIEQAFRAQAASETEARRSEERMRRFIGDASHELRTPLTSIRGFAELYRQGAVSQPEDVARVMGRIEDESTRMTGLVEDLLLLARLDQQRPLERAPVELARLAEDAVLDAQAAAPDSPVALELLDRPRIHGDEAKLRQVLGNLVRNALVHTPAGTAVSVRVLAMPGIAVLEVADQGPGIEPADAQRIFERFFRTDASRTRSAEQQQGSGYGLGLSIVAAIVAAHGGTVGVKTAPGYGAVFRVLLPLEGTPTLVGP